MLSGTWTIITFIITEKNPYLKEETERFSNKCTNELNNHPNNLAVNFLDNSNFYQGSVDLIF